MSNYNYIAMAIFNNYFVLPGMYYFKNLQFLDLQQQMINKNANTIIANVFITRDLWT